MEMVETKNYDDLFKSVVKGIKKLKIDDKEFEIQINNEESLTVLQFYSIFYRNTMQENPVSKKSVDLVKNTMKKVFQRSYPGINEQILDEFLESRFLEIVSGVSVACGWMKPEQQKSESEGVTLNG